jgi:hypothetical protein
MTRGAAPVNISSASVAAEWSTTRKLTGRDALDQAVLFEPSQGLPDRGLADLQPGRQPALAAGDLAAHISPDACRAVPAF